ncbi:hypothetical protein C8R45DRAFT_1215354 [Mycena sanguinolenta]|nr:hypothetical protein C8R45DRAFT_1215354 [Mycena sanguinolenta]
MNNAPCFPPELEREIFEIAANLHPQSIPSLLQVSRRVHDWIEWIQYRTVTTNGALCTCPTRVLLQAIQSNSKPESFFRDRVRHLHIVGFGPEVLEDASKILPVCSRVQNLRMDIRANHIQQDLILSVLAALKLRRLSAWLEIGLMRNPMPMLASVTHLNVFDWLPPSPATNDQLLSWLVQFPVLTHVAFHHDSVPFARDILAVCKNLRVLIFLHQERHTHGQGEDNPWAEDDRFIWMSMQCAWNDKAWITGSNEGMDFWTSAEIFIARKRRREIVPNSRCWIEKEDGIGCEYFTDATESL